MEAMNGNDRVWNPGASFGALAGSGVSLICSQHPWSLPSERGCLTCGWSRELEAIQAAQDELAEKQALTIRRRKAALAERTRKSDAAQAFGRMQSGRTLGTHRLREAAQRLRERAIPMLRSGMRAVEVDAELGKHRGWCSKAGALHPEMANAIRAGKLKRRAERVREIEARRVLEAERRAGRPARARQPQMTEADVRSIVARRDSGESLTSIAADIDRNITTVRAAYQGWIAGTSRIARRAIEAGTWGETREAAQ